MVLKRHTFHIISIILITITILSCSRRKDKFLNRSFHAVTTKYNVLHNGDIAFESGKQALIKSFYDNYWEILPVERMQIKEDLLLPGASKDPNFERAEEKAAKAIQKHGMNIGGKEKNPQTDEAYLLLGKARYFDQRFVPALEAFNYILYKHPTSDKINHARIWREKVNIRLENTELAIKNLKRLIDKEQLSKQDLSDAHAMMAQAYVNNKHLDSAIAHIKIAVENTKDKEVRGRLGFIKGQIYNRLGYKDSANIAFDEVIKLKRKTLWIYHVNARVAKARNFDFEKGDKLAYIEYLTKLSEDRENRPYLDKIYNLIGDYHNEVTSDSLAEVFYKKSLRQPTQDRYLQSLNYRKIAEFRFDAAAYKEAGAYYDSTLSKLKVNTKEYRLFRKKRDNLKDVIAYEDLAKRNDSIIKVLNYTEDERITYYEKYIEKLKAEEKAKEEAEAAKLLAQANNNQFLPKTGGKQNANTTFYFYNPTTVAYGKNEFRKIWGDRKLEDDWRRADKGIKIKNDTEEEEGNTDLAKEEIKDVYNPEFYTSKLPSTQKEVDSIIKKRNFAYYQLGLIYKQKFKEYPLAAKRLEKLLTFKPGERLALPAKYQLYKIYTELKDQDQNRVKQDIITNYPDSRYAEILRNPDASLSFAEGSPEVVYKKLYKQFENQEYETVLSELDKYLVQFEGDEMIAKYELLKANTLGKIEGFAAYKKAMNYVALNYPNTDEGKGAQNLLQQSIPKLENLAIIDNVRAKKFKLVYILDKNNKEEIKELKESIGEALKNTYRDDLKVSYDYYDREKAFVVVHGFITPETAKNFHFFLKENSKKYKSAEEYLTLSSVNYKTLQIHKKLTQIQKSPKINQ